MKIQGFSARTRAAVRVCAVLAPLAVTSACRTESEVASRADDPAAPATPAASATPSRAAAATGEGSMGNYAGASGGTRAKGEESAATGAVDLESLAGHGWRPTTAPPQAGIGHGQSVGGIGLSGGSNFASPPAVVASGPVMLGRAIQASGSRPVAAASPGGCTPADPLCSSASQAKGREAAEFGIIGLSVSATSASTPAAAWRSDGVGAEPVAPALARLDPNARYATTYRPGGAALAAFDAAVSRGQIPTSFKDLVGDFGARYAPALEAPRDGALAIAVSTARAAVGPAGGPAEPPGRADLERGHAGARSALGSHRPRHQRFDERPGDRGREAERPRRRSTSSSPPTTSRWSRSRTRRRSSSPDGPIGPRRAQVLSRIHGVQAGGGTNIWAGLDLGYAEARAPGAGDEAVRLVMLLSDGHANGGETSPEHLAERAARAFQDGIQTSAFGLGPDYDAALMSGIADRGAGGYYYVADSSQIEPALAREIDARLRPVATAVEVRVRLRPDVSATHVFGSRELTAIEADAVRAQEVAVDRHEKEHHGIAADRQVDAAGGMRFFIPAFARADRHATMITLAAAARHRRAAHRERRGPLQGPRPQEERDAGAPREPALGGQRRGQRAHRRPRRRARRAGVRRRRGDPPGGRARRRRRPRRARATSSTSARPSCGCAESTLQEARFGEDAARLDRLGDAVGGTAADGGAAARRDAPRLRLRVPLMDSPAPFTMKLPLDRVTALAMDPAAHVVGSPGR